MVLMIVVHHLHLNIIDWLNAQTSNTAPVAVADTATVAEDASLTSIDVITNDTDVDGDALTLTAVTTAGSGTVAINGVSVDYTPAANFNGEEVITYTVSDGTAYRCDRNINDYSYSG